MMLQYSIFQIKRKDQQLKDVGDKLLVITCTVWISDGQHGESAEAAQGLQLEDTLGPLNLLLLEAAAVDITSFIFFWHYEACEKKSKELEEDKWNIYNFCKEAMQIFFSRLWKNRKTYVLILSGFPLNTWLQE